MLMSGVSTTSSADAAADSAAITTAWPGIGPPRRLLNKPPACVWGACTQRVQHSASPARHWADGKSHTRRAT